MLEILRTLRKQKGISMKQLGETIGVAEPTISAYENGRNEPPLDILCALADFYDVSLDLLVRGKEKDRPEERSVKGIMEKYDGLSEEQIMMMIASLQALLADKRFQAHLRPDGQV